MASILLRLNTFIRSEAFQKYFFNTSWLLIERVVNMGIALLVGIYLARYLGPNDWGLFNYARSFAAIIVTVAPLGIDSILTRNLLNEPGNRNTILGTAFAIRFIGALSCLFFVIIANYFVQHDSLTSYLVIIVATATIFESFNIINQFFTSEVQSKYQAYTELIRTFASTVIKIILIYSKANLVWFAVVLVFDALFYGIVLVIFYVQNYDTILKWKSSMSYAKGLLQDSWPLMLSGFVIMIYMKIDQVMIKYLMDNEAVGYYSAALRLSESTYFIPMVIRSSLFPAIMNAKKISQEKYHESLQKLYNFLVLVTVGLAVIVTFFGNWVIVLLYGQEYQSAGNVLIVHIWSGVFVGLGVASGNWLIAENLQKISLYRTALGAVVNIGLNFVFIPWLGIVGAAVATLISQAIASYLGFLLSKNTWIVFKMQTKALFGYDYFIRIKNYLTA